MSLYERYVRLPIQSSIRLEPSPNGSPSPVEADRAASAESHPSKLRGLHGGSAASTSHLSRSVASVRHLRKTDSLQAGPRHSPTGNQLRGQEGNSVRKTWPSALCHNLGDAGPCEKLSRRARVAHAQITFAEACCAIGTLTAGSNSSARMFPCGRTDASNFSDSGAFLCLFSDSGAYSDLNWERAKKTADRNAGSVCPLLQVGNSLNPGANFHFFLLLF